jgi:hypothetical protein
LTEQNGDEMTSFSHKQEQDGSDIESADTSPLVQPPPALPELHTREHPRFSRPSKGNEHQKFKRNAYVVPVRMYNPATAIGAVHSIVAHQNEAQPSVLHRLTSAKQDKVADSVAVPPISVEHHCHPTVPPTSQSSLDSCDLDGETAKSHLAYPSKILNKDPKFSGQEFKTQSGDDTKASTEQAGCSFVAEETPEKQDQILVPPSLVTRRRDVDPGHISSTVAHVQDNQIEDGKQYDRTGRTEVDITLQQILNDLSLQANKRNNEPTDEPNGHINEDDSASLNTRNEWWSVSSFHSRTAHFEDGDRPADEDLPPPPPEGFPDFELPFDSLLKPIKKSTYHPIIQDGVLQFLESANWQTHPTDEDSGPVWTAKHIPLQRVDVGIAATSESRQPERQGDRFLESIEVIRRNEQEALQLVSNGARRNITERDSLRGAFRPSLTGNNPSYTEEHIITSQVVITQTTPEWYLRHRHHQSLTVHSQDLNAQEAAQQVDIASSALVSKETCKVLPDCYNPDIGMPLLS